MKPVFSRDESELYSTIRHQAELIEILQTALARVPKQPEQIIAAAVFTESALLAAAEACADSAAI